MQNLKNADIAPPGATIILFGYDASTGQLVRITLPDLVDYLQANLDFDPKDGIDDGKDPVIKDNG